MITDEAWQPTTHARRQSRVILWSLVPAPLLKGDPLAGSMLFSSCIHNVHRDAQSKTASVSRVEHAVQADGANDPDACSAARSK